MSTHTWSVRNPRLSFVVWSSAQCMRTKREFLGHPMNPCGKLGPPYTDLNIAAAITAPPSPFRVSGASVLNYCTATENAFQFCPGSRGDFPHSSLGHNRWLCNQFTSFSSVLHCPLGLGELQVWPFPDVVFPPRLLSALSAAPFYCKIVLVRLMNEKLVPTTSVYVSFLPWSGGLHVVPLTAGSWQRLPRWHTWSFVWDA